LSIRTYLGDRYYGAKARLHREFGSLRSLRELGPAARRDFERARNEDVYRAAYLDEMPLVTVCMATYNRADLLFERTLPSVFAQSYANFEIVLVGDECTDDTAARAAAIDDPRFHFVNLARRGDYPKEPIKRWMVAGTKPMNVALALAGGAFVTHLDDDDSYTPTRLAELVALIRSTRSDLVFHPFEVETADDQWTVNPALEFQLGGVTTGSILYHRWLTRIGWDPFAYLHGEPGDWNRLRKFKFLGVHARRCESILMRHHKERQNRG
jgi:glycosyltransferase involved in cell wall biosynthesis